MYGIGAKGKRAMDCRAWLWLSPERQGNINPSRRWFYRKHFPWWISWYESSGEEQPRSLYAGLILILNFINWFKSELVQVGCTCEVEVTWHLFGFVQFYNSGSVLQTWIKSLFFCLLISLDSTSKLASWFPWQLMYFEQGKERTK